MHHRDYDDLLDDHCRSLRVDPLLLDRERLDDLPLDALRAYAQGRVADGGGRCAFPKPARASVAWEATRRLEIESDIADLPKSEEPRA